MVDRLFVNTTSEQYDAKFISSCRISETFIIHELSVKLFDAMKKFKYEFGIILWSKLHNIRDAFSNEQFAFFDIRVTMKNVASTKLVMTRARLETVYNGRTYIKRG